MNQNSSILLDHLVSDFCVSVRDPLWGDILLTAPIQILIKHPLVYKLSRIRQLGPTSILYPGAVHTRLSHSLGVYDISRRILISLVRHGCSFLTITGIYSFLIAALLHDIGHFPYAHSLKNILSESHEKLAAILITSDISLRNNIKETGADPEAVASIICPGFCISQSLEDNELTFYQKLLSGTLDPDKLDYLCRDAFFCGVPYGIQDVSYIVDHMQCSGNQVVFSGDTGSIEHLLFSKYMMYRNVYWHRTVRSATAMVRKAVTCAISNGIFKEDDLYFQDDTSFFEMCNRNNYRPLQLVGMVFNGDVFTSYMEPDCPSSMIPDREELENEVRKDYPSLQSWEVTADIPEPISFETDINVLSSSGESIQFRPKAIVPESFACSLVKIRVFHR